MCSDVGFFNKVKSSHMISLMGYYHAQRSCLFKIACQYIAGYVPVPNYMPVSNYLPVTNYIPIKLHANIYISIPKYMSVLSTKLNTSTACSVSVRVQK